MKTSVNTYTLKQKKEIKKALDIIMSLAFFHDKNNLQDIGPSLLRAYEGIQLLPKDNELITKLLQQETFDLNECGIRRVMGAFNYIELIFHNAKN